MVNINFKKLINLIRLTLVTCHSHLQKKVMNHNKLGNVKYYHQ
jgi:hypothetical protein